MQSQKDSAILTAIVLAGGQSSRMGRDKALIPIEGTPMLSLICKIAKQCSDRLAVVTPWPEKYQPLLPSDCDLIQEIPTIGETESHGPLIGFSQGLAHLEKKRSLQTDWVLLLACDLPRLRLEVLQNWVGELRNVPQEAIALLPKHPKGWEPLCGFYRPRCLPQLIDFINRGGRSFQQWLASQTVRELPLSDPQMLFNCNTPTDLLSVDS